MDLSPAPFHQLPDSSEVPAEAYWLRSDDDIRLRVALWRADNPTETVLLFPGRTEYVEKYAPVAGVLTQLGIEVHAVKPYHGHPQAVWQAITIDLAKA